MKKKASTKNKKIALIQNDMRPEYDFTGGVRGKHYKARQQGYTIRIHRADGTTTVKHVKREAAVTLAPDVQEYFPNSRAVNHALRTLITLFPEKRKSVRSKAGTHLERKLASKGRNKRSTRT